MKNLINYIGSSINEAKKSVQLPPDAEQKIENLFKLFARDIKEIMSLAPADTKDLNEFSGIGPFITGETVYTTNTAFSISKDKKTQDKIEKFIENPKGWEDLGDTSKGKKKGSRYIKDAQYRVYKVDSNNNKCTAYFSVDPDGDNVTSIAINLSYPVLSDEAKRIYFNVNMSDATKDITGRPIKEGDNVVYSDKSTVGKKVMPYGVVLSVTAKDVSIWDEVNNSTISVPGFKCCVISEK